MEIGNNRKMSRHERKQRSVHNKSGKTLVAIQPKVSTNGDISEDTHIQTTYILSIVYIHYSWRK